MVELTYQMVLSTLQTAGILVGIFYYIMTLRNQNRIRETQWIWQLLNRKTDNETMKGFLNQISSNWKDYDDYLQKYDHSVNLEHGSTRQSSWYFFDILGIMVKQNKIDIEMIYPFYNMHILLLWFKYETVIKVLREGTMDEDYMEGLEFLADEMIKMRQEKGLKIPSEFLHPTSTLLEELSNR
jgi:hypothetical protein